MTSTAIHTVVNRREHPRILIINDNQDFAERVMRDVELPGTVKVIWNLDEVDQSEWDAVFLSELYNNGIPSAAPSRGAAPSRRYSRTVADHLYVFLVLPEFGHNGVLDQVKGLNDNEEPIRLRLRWNVPGHEVRAKQGLHRELQNSLLVAVESRDTQSGLPQPDELPTGVELDSFAIGPQKLVLAGSVKAPDRGEVWFVPNAVSDLAPWVTAAFQSWRRSDALKFPGLPDWWNAREWHSADESVIAERIDQETAEFEAARAKYESATTTLQTELETARAKATGGVRQLLRGQDDALQEAVGVALTELGFNVRDMDLEWNEKERREDFRITDDQAPGWLVLGDATGVRGNAKGSKIATLRGYVTKYVFEEKPDKLPGMWFLLNREIDRDPNTRSTILRSDEVEPFAADQGLILDTTALFVLLRHAERHPDDKPAIRDYLRGASGLVDLANARAWLDGRSP